MVSREGPLRDMIHGESGARGGLIQPYCLLSIGLYQAPDGIAVELCDVDVMEGKAFNTTFFRDAWQRRLPQQ